MRRACLVAAALLLACALSRPASPELAGDRAYAIVVSRETLKHPGWKAVVDELARKYGAQVLTYDSDVYEVRLELARLAPDYLCFVARPEEARPDFVKRVNRLVRELDRDPYPDAVWAILTGYTHEDALRIVRCSGFRVRSVLSGCSAGWLEYVQSGIATSEVRYGVMWVKYPNGTIRRERGPDDRTLFLAALLATNRFDMFITSGHGNHDRWQLHYPDPGREGFFISRSGRVYAVAKNGTAVAISTTNPKIYFGLGNCYIGSIVSRDSMPLAWIHSCGACFYAGYVIEEGPGSYMMGGIPAYFFVQDDYTWAEAFFANAVSLVFDMLHGTPGPDHSWLRVDVDGAALYGEPALDVRAGLVKEPLYSKSVKVRQLGGGLVEVTVRIRMNRDGTPGWNGKWGNRHPVVILPVRVEDATVLSTNAYKAVVADNFVLLYVWKKGDPPLKAGEERFVVFRAKLMERPREVSFEEERGLRLWWLAAAAVAAGLVALTYARLRRRRASPVSE